MSDTWATQLAQSWVGKTLRGKWIIDRLIGVGGMANVYAARHHRNGREVAIKLLLPEFAQHAEVCKRFLREGYVANRIDHPGVVGILDDDETEDGLPFLVMELLKGMSMLERLEAAKTLTVAEALFIADQVLDVLSAAHEAAIVHRDIKPGNVFLLADGRVKVLDFGLARVLQGEEMFLTRKGLVLGTVSYMAPEQGRASGERVDGRSDIYAVGSTLFLALSGEFVHVARNVKERLTAVTSSEARPLRSVVPNLPDQVYYLVDKALRFAPEERWPDARAMQKEVREAYSDLTSHAIPLTQRVKRHGVEGWTRPATMAAEMLAPSKPDVTALDISVVFEPSSQDWMSVPVEIVVESESS